MNKYEYACTIAASLAYLVLKQNDAISCMTFDQKLRRSVPSRTRQSHLGAVVEALSVSDPADKTEIYSVMRGVAENHPRRGMMVLISDLLANQAATLKGLRLLRQRGHDVLVFHIMDDDELDFPFQGPMRFEGLESNDFLTCNPRALREGYLAALQEFLDLTRRGCAQDMIDYALIRTRQPLDSALATYLCSRLGMHNRN